MKKITMKTAMGNLINTIKASECLDRSYEYALSGDFEAADSEYMAGITLIIGE